MNEKRHTDRDPGLDRHFAERVSEHFQPEPLAPSERARFDAELRERIHGRRRAPIWAPALVGTAAALALLWWASPIAEPIPQSERASEVAASSQVDSASEIPSNWEAEVLLVGADAVVLEEAYLPDDYEAIALAFLDGV